VAVERTQAPFAQIGAEDVQLRLLGKFEEARIAVEILLIVAFQQARSCQLAIRESEKAPRQTQRYVQRKAPDDPVADIQVDEREELGRRGIEVRGGSVVTIPVEYEVGGDNAAAGDRSD